MKVKLKQIIDELTDAIGLPEGQKVGAIVDKGNVVGWIIVDVYENGRIKPISDKKYNNIKELLTNYGLRKEV